MKNRLTCITTALLALMFAFASCNNGGGGDNDNTVSVTSVSLNKTTTTLAVGGTETLVPTIQPPNATNKNVTWDSSNTGVATVNSSTGLVTGVNAGTTTITVTTQDGNKTATCTVTVSASAVAVVIKIGVDQHYSLAISGDGSLWAWGNNEQGQLGDGTMENRYAPVSVGANSIWKAVSAGFEHTIALKTDGSLWAWGGNFEGQLGLGYNSPEQNPNIADPTRVGDESNWATVSARNAQTMALKTDGSLWAWGKNYWGQLGLGDSGLDTDRNAPVHVGDASDWAAISMGSQHAVALKKDGSLWAWGKNEYGSLGDGTEIDKNAPICIGSETNWAAISVGYEHTIAMKKDGSLWGWGSNSFGQVGGDIGRRSSLPVPIGTDTDWTSVSAGYYHTMAVKKDGSLWAWGYNYHGQLGLGDKGTERYSPEPVGTDTDWVAVYACHYHTIAVKENGSLWAWGYNDYGRLGDGTTENSLSPVRVVGWQ